MVASSRAADPPGSSARNAESHSGSSAKNTSTGEAVPAESALSRASLLPASRQTTGTLAVCTPDRPAHAEATLFPTTSGGMPCGVRPVGTRMSTDAAPGTSIGCPSPRRILSSSPRINGRWATLTRAAGARHSGATPAPSVRRSPMTIASSRRRSMTRSTSRPMGSNVPSVRINDAPGPIDAAMLRGATTPTRPVTVAPSESPRTGHGSWTPPSASSRSAPAASSTHIRGSLDVVTPLTPLSFPDTTTSPSSP